MALSEFYNYDKIKMNIHNFVKRGQYEKNPDYGG